MKFSEAILRISVVDEGETRGHDIKEFSISLTNQAIHSILGSIAFARNTHKVVQITLTDDTSNWAGLEPATGNDHLQAINICRDFITYTLYIGTESECHEAYESSPVMCDDFLRMVAIDKGSGINLPRLH
ncbi:MAG: hypothetical protein KAJ03_00695 [Gammaproteobacteria bacterium]|nr:hypothetical protein [Gammaproteobacteria bacterium]